MSDFQKREKDESTVVSQGDGVPINSTNEKSESDGKLVSKQVASKNASSRSSRMANS